MTVGVALVSFRWLEVPVLQHGFGVLLPDGLRRRPAGRRGRRPRRAGAPVWVVPVAATAVVAVLAAFTFSRPVSTADLDVPPLLASDGEFTRADPPVDFALLGDSVGASLAKGWRGEDYPGVTMSNQSRIVGPTFQRAQSIQHRVMPLFPADHGFNALVAVQG